jgi:hypothetical protein
LGLGKAKNAQAVWFARVIGGTELTIVLTTIIATKPGNPAAAFNAPTIPECAAP